MLQLMIVFIIIKSTALCRNYLMFGLLNTIKQSVCRCYLAQGDVCFCPTNSHVMYSHMTKKIRKFSPLSGVFRHLSIKTTSKSKLHNIYMYVNAQYVQTVHYRSISNWITYSAFFRLSESFFFSNLIADKMQFIMHYFGSDTEWK